MTKNFNVEIFSNNTFLNWFPASSMKEVLNFIAKYEGVIRLSDLKLTYLIFQQTDHGVYQGLASRYHRVCSIHATGKEKPKFFSLVK